MAALPFEAYPASGPLVLRWRMVRAISFIQGFERHMSHYNSMTTLSHGQHVAGRLGRRLGAGLLGLVLTVMGTAASAQAYVNGSVSGQIAPGVYGRVDIGNAPAPALIYQQPMLIAPPPVAVPAPPVYMYVPPGHAKHWGKHCARYGACGQRVYFLRNPPPHWRGGGDRDRWDHDRRDRHRHDRHDRHDRDHWRDRDRDHGHHGRHRD